MIRVSVVLLLLLPAAAVLPQALPLPPRPSDAPGGRVLGDTLGRLPRVEREARIWSEFVRGNVPASFRSFVPVRFERELNGRAHSITVFVTPDYCSLGSDDDHLLMPMTPVLAQRIASDIGCSLPTTLIVDRVFAQASIRLHPQPIPPTDTMTSVSVFLQHNDSVHAQLRSLGTAVAPGSLLAGHKKDVVLSNLITHGLKPGRPFPVVIYGWHRPDGTVIQPPYNGHGETYADYSHGVRLVRDTLLIDGRPESLRLLLVDPERSALVSDEGAISQPYYRTHDNQP